MKDYEHIISTLLAKIAELEDVVKQQAAKIAGLEKRLNKNSHNIPHIIQNASTHSCRLCEPERSEWCGNPVTFKDTRLLRR